MTTFSSSGRISPLHVPVVSGLLVMLALLLCWGRPTGAAPTQMLTLRDMAVDTQDEDVVLRFGVDLETAGQVTAMLQDGEILGLRCRATLERRRTLWFNKTLTEVQRVIVFRYDPLNNRYLAEDEKGLLAEHPDVAGLFAQTLGRIAIDLGPRDALPVDEDYRVDLTVRMDRVNVPAWLKRALFFWDFEVSPETRYQFEFSY